MRVLLLCHKDLIPPQSNPKVREAQVAEAESIDDVSWRTEYHVQTALQRLGAEVQACGVGPSLRPLKRALKTFKPDVVFNLLEEFSGEALLEFFAVSFLEGEKQPFTGCGPEALILAKNKIAAKALMRAAGLRVPDEKRYPKIVKFVDEEASRGIDESSIVHDHDQEAAIKKKLAALKIAQVFSEEYIHGRELHVGVIVNGRETVVTPVWETDFGRKPDTPIISEKVKWDFAYRKEMGIRLRPAKGLSERVISAVQKAARIGCEALEMDGYARVDIRLPHVGGPVILEVNPNPDLAPEDEFAMCAESAGWTYDALIRQILDHALTRKFARPRNGRDLDERRRDKISRADPS